MNKFFSIALLFLVVHVSISEISNQTEHDAILETVEVSQFVIDRMSEEAGTIPLQAATCDIAGIGRVSTYTNQSDVVTIDSLWYGDYTNQTIELSVKCEEIPPTNACLFFISRSADVAFTEPEIFRYSYMFRLAGIRDKVITNSCYFELPVDLRNRIPPLTSVITNDGFYLMNDVRSLIPIDQMNMPMITWASNLIVSTQINPNYTNFCDLLLEGYIATNGTKRMKSDVMDTFQFIDTFLTTNEILYLYHNNDLDNNAKTKLENAFHRSTGHFITNHSSDTE